VGVTRGRPTSGPDRLRPSPSGAFSPPWTRRSPAIGARSSPRRWLRWERPTPAIIDRVDQLRRAYLRYYVNRQAAEELPGVAVQALTDGVDTPSLRVLAGYVGRDPREANELFAAVVDELGWPTPDPGAARRELAMPEIMEICERLASGSGNPYEDSLRIFFLTQEGGALDENGEENTPLTETLYQFLNLHDAAERRPCNTNQAAIVRNLIRTSARAALNGTDMPEWSMDLAGNVSPGPRTA